MEKPIAYDGDKPFIFISYSHRDIDRVWPIISQMNKNGYRVWYDDGIDPGTEWDEFIANKISNCDYFIGFMSANYLASDNCKDELNYARDQVDNRLLVYLEEVQLPRGMEMRLGRIQAIHKYNFPTEPDFFNKFYQSKNLYSFRDNIVVKRANPEERKKFVAGEGSAAFADAGDAAVAPVEKAEVVASNPVPSVKPVSDVQPQPVYSDSSVVIPTTEMPKINNVEANKKKGKKPFELPTTKWGVWGIPGFRTNNAMHMVISIIGLIIYFILLLIFILAIVDNPYNDGIVATGIAGIISSTVGLLFMSDYGWVQERLLKLHKLNSFVRGLISFIITVILVAVLFFVIVFICTLFG